MLKLYNFIFMKKKQQTNHFFFFFFDIFFCFVFLWVGQKSKSRPTEVLCVSVDPRAEVVVVVIEEKVFCMNGWMVDNYCCSYCCGTYDAFDSDVNSSSSSRRLRDLKHTLTTIFWPFRKRMARRNGRSCSRL